MNFSGLELKAIVNLATAIAKSDGNVAEAEMAVVANELVLFGVTEDQVEDIVFGASGMSNKDAIAVVSMMDDYHKKYVTAFLAMVIAADGKIEDSEVRMWSLITLLCGLPKMSIAEGIEFWSMN